VSGLAFTYTGADLYALCSDAMLKAISRKTTIVDQKVKDINVTRSASGQPPISIAYFFDHLASKSDIAVTVEEEDFLAASRELVLSVSADELRHYEKIRKDFEGAATVQANRNASDGRILEEPRKKSVGKNRRHNSALSTQSRGGLAGGTESKGKLANLEKGKPRHYSGGTISSDDSSSIEKESNLRNGTDGRGIGARSDSSGYNESASDGSDNDYIIRTDHLKTDRSDQLNTGAGMNHRR
jgi:peroxin-6